MRSGRWGSMPRRAGLIAVLGGAALLAGCVGSHYQQFPQTTFEPLTEYGWKIQRLFELILWPAAVVFIVVEGALLYAHDMAAEGHGMEPHLSARLIRVGG